MADAAAFFANKKKKKKAFKFNANKIDASTVEKKVHVDAPALSTDNDAAAAASAAANAPDAGIIVNADATSESEQWDDEAMAATMVQKKAIASTANSTTELLDMKALDLKRSEQGDIQEKLRVEANKAKLAAAREGMEKEAQRLKEEKEKKEQQASSSKPRFGAAAAGMGAPGAGGGKWLPPHLRGGGASLSSQMGGGISGGFGQKLDTEDENLFPDLAAADAIIEKQKQQGPAYKAPKKTPVGGGATWGSKAKVQQKKVEEKPDETEAPAPSEPEKSEAAAPEPTPAPAAAPAVKAPIKPKKKKKKDLSTFKASS